MSDRELLEMAAKAAGSLVAWRESAQCFCPVGSPYEVAWNPLTDDGDALRLAVKLRMELSIDPGHSWAMAEHDLHAGKACETGEDPCAATRRAIVRAAAAIGRSTIDAARGKEGGR